MSHAIYTPDRGIVEKLRRIDPDLSVAWVETPKGPRWGVYYDLQVPGNLDSSIDTAARALQLDLAMRGYTVDLADCAYTARQAIQDAKLVCYCVEEDGEYRPLDDRLVEKVERMDHYRRNLDIRDWRLMLGARADVARRQRERDQDDVWELIRKDRVLLRQASDILWGVKPVRSITVEETLHG